MKKITVFKTLTLTLVVLLGISLTACNDNDEMTPVGLADVNGTYKGMLVKKQGNKGGIIEKAIEFSANDNHIIFKDFPIEKLVRSVVKDSIKADSALAKIGKFEYKLGYSSVLDNNNNRVELTFEPKNILVQIPVDGVIKNAVVKVLAKEKGLYLGQDRSLRLSWTAEKIIVDGVEEFPFERIQYNIPYSLKN